MEESNGVAGRHKPEVAKTGLGSSAAMTTSVVAALLQYLGAVSLPIQTKSHPEEKSVNSDLDLVHIVAQSAHCIAQGKVGSGFDVSAAVYGSQRYVRFSPGVLSSAQVFLLLLAHMLTADISSLYRYVILFLANFLIPCQMNTISDYLLTVVTICLFLNVVS